MSQTALDLAGDRCWPSSAANLPFVNQRLLARGAAAPGRKSLALRLAELVLLYFVVGGVGLLLEKRAGQIAPQGWEFYAVTGALFVTLRLPRLHLALPAASHPQAQLSMRMPTTAT